MSCPNCASERLTTIRILLAPEEEHVFTCCHDCEWKGWSKAGSAVPLGRVLALAAERRF
ncbi:MAG TPA: hypothetical protein VFD04_03230 [Actinomycetes bacterium]|jgi:hypothetical protein|nr:hypothetical protein [Actinomycetes bacterium]